ncbi:Nitrogen fixation protein FixH [Mesorhizobium albiziae]|uniref:Nitrogen fixation protein FixH n=1 Tax=Neomesorhizobium albiziae TaxID=335020 RepID=A0A1I3ZQB1_9HYPH|nr:FixH family protein [Mesorhizobium albiziae]GLS32282.1 cytochrome oxidase [Mesorhizobium albiziae]SFK45749.1 Nitrogen fixation protein FixH [Mesorhizobium albiziae]
MNSQSGASGRFTGTHMLGIMLAFFGVIVAVNLTMAMLASTSWTGFVVRNSYVASQEFNRKSDEARAQAALGWTSRLSISGGEIRYKLIDAGGKAVALRGVTAHFRHPAYEAQDQTVDLSPATNGEFAAALTLREGAWIMEIEADAGIGNPHRDVRRIMVRDGTLQ